MDVESIAQYLQYTFLSTTSAWLARKDWQVSHSSEGEISTSVDAALETELKLLLASIRPQAAFLGEEQFRTKRQSLAQYAACEELWIVDPLDGTSNFVSGNDDFGMIVAYAKHAITTAAWILAPRRNAICCAELGAGVWLNGQKCAAVGTGREATIGILATGDFTPSEISAAEHLRARLTKSRGTRACAIDYIELIAGHADLALYKRTRPWDHAAGVLAFSEVGGRHMTFSGGCYNLLEDNQGLLLASSEESLQAAASILQIGQ